MDYCKLDSATYLVRQYCKPVHMSIEPSNTHYIWIYDRSGSMTHMLPELAQDMIQHSASLQVGDMLSLGYFSGPGCFRFILKGHVVTGEESLAFIKKIILSNSSAMNTTCFSEILQDTISVCNELRDDERPFSMFFFTDGYPVVPDYDLEIRNIMSALNQLKDRLGRAIWVGYGLYYNRELIGKMVERVGGIQIHSSNIHELSEPAFRNMLLTGSPNTRIVKIDNAFGIPDYSFYMDSDGIVMLKRNGDDLTVPTTTDQIWHIYSTTYNPEKLNWSKFKIEDMLDGAYAAAMIFSQKLHADMSLYILGKIGDVSLIDDLNDAFTNDEFGNVERAMSRCALNSKSRFVAGKKMGYVPRRDRFCYLDLADLLLTDLSVMVFPYHKAFEYHRATQKMKQKEGYPEFMPVKDKGQKPITIKWHDTRLNFSILVRINGTIDLGTEAEKFGLSRNYPTYIYRNYMLVKDGMPNVKQLVVSMSKSTFDVLKKEHIISHMDTWEAGVPFVLNMKRIPVMNRAMAEDMPTAQELCQMRTREIVLEAQQKAINWIIEQKTEAAKSIFTKEQMDFLKSKGITYNGFNPPTEPEESTDYYMADEIEIKVKGFSSLPSVKSVVEKAAAGKAIGGTDLFLFNAYRSVEKVDHATELSNIKSELNIIRSRLARAKFAVVLGKRWFTGITRENPTLEVQGFTCTFDLSRSKVEY